jgi:hypothetical protein
VSQPSGILCGLKSAEVIPYSLTSYQHEKEKAGMTLFLREVTLAGHKAAAALHEQEKNGHRHPG